jgi:hypothetical protein
MADNREEINNGDGAQVGGENESERHLLHDLEHYVHSRGIENDRDNLAPNLNHLESQQRVDAAQDYQDQVHKEVFEAVNANCPGHQREQTAVEARKQLVDLYTANGTNVDIVVSEGNGVIEGVALHRLVEKCDTIFTMANSNLWTSKEDSKQLVASKTTPAQGGTTNNKEVALLEFELDPVREFLDILLDKKTLDDINEDHIVACCRIAHFLQCNLMLDPIVKILIDSVDARNSLSLCNLADQLELPALFEASVACLMSSLDNLQDNELWNGFPKDLQNRVITLRNAVQSSIMSRGQTAKVFFTSSDEFLAIFFDHIRDQQERLREAKDRQNEIIEGRTKLGDSHEDIMGGSVRDAEGKIQRQEIRLQTLEVFYQDQKKIFRQSSESLVATNRAPFVLG